MSISFLLLEKMHRPDVLPQSLNIVDIVLVYICVDAGMGRHIADPSVGMANILRFAYYLWILQICNVIAVAFLKWSICAYLLALNFSRVYRYIVYFTILVVTALNFLAPFLTFLGCVPMESNWNRNVKGTCWAKSSLQLSYTQGISNILTDVVYMVAPIIYLSRVQLSKRTQWGLRAVFLLSIV